MNAQQDAYDRAMVRLTEAKARIRELEARLVEKDAEIQRLKDESEMIHYKKALESIAEGIIPWVEGCSEDPATVIMRYARTVLD